MGVAYHLSIFILSLTVVWLCAGLLINSIDRLARRFHKSGFIVSFFALGFLTSISELSVGVNSTLEGLPSISVGNLVGASFVVAIFLIPLLAVISGKIKLDHTLSNKNLLFAFVVMVSPVLLVMDGNVQWYEGVFSILLYAVLLIAIGTQKESLGSVVEETEADIEFTISKKATAWDITKIVFGAVCIFGAGHFLVQQGAYIAEALNVPASIIGLLVLSLGTNIPELVIVIRSVLTKHSDIAFGDYIGSATMNALIFGGVAIANGSFFVEASEFIIIAILTVVGLVLLYIFSRSERTISRREGAILLGLYALFLCAQIITILRA